MSVPQDELNDPKPSFDRIDITCVNGTGDKALLMAFYEEKWKVTGNFQRNEKAFNVHNQSCETLFLSVSYYPN